MSRLGCAYVVDVLWNLKTEQCYGNQWISENNNSKWEDWKNSHIF